MELDLMFIGSEEIVSRCRQPRSEVMELVSAAVGKKHYGTTLELVGVNVVFQDTGMIKLATRIFRKRKEASVDLELSRHWAKNASDAEIKLAFLRCLTKAVEMAGERLTRDDDDFDAQALTADLQTVISKLKVDSSRSCEQAAGDEQVKCESERHEEIREHKTLIVQYRTEGWGSSQDLEMRWTVESLLDECLKSMSNGYCDGGDIGSGTINIFLSVLDPHRATEAVIEALRKAQLLEGATIALEDEEKFEVLWPEGFEGGFSYSY
jgi:hypothetical protein